MLVAEVLRSQQVQTLQPDASVREAAQVMRDHDIGDVLVCDGDQLVGIVTDRDIAVRAAGDGKDPDTCTVDEICSPNMVTIDSMASTDDAASMMRQFALRRLPVIGSDGLTLYGVVTLGDLAREVDPHGALADISRAPSNN